MRKLKEEIKKSIKEAFQAYGKSGAPSNHVAELCASHTISLIENLDTCQVYFEDEGDDNPMGLSDEELENKDPDGGPECDECGEKIPSKCANCMNAYHKESCSLFDPDYAG